MNKIYLMLDILFILYYVISIGINFSLIFIYKKNIINYSIDTLSGIIFLVMSIIGIKIDFLIKYCLLVNLFILVTDLIFIIIKNLILIRNNKKLRR